MDNEYRRLAHPIEYSFSQLLEKEPPESEIQSWLERHPRALGGEQAVLKKATLGSEYELDFLTVENITVGFTWNIVEVKRPDSSLFRKDDLPSDDINSAVAQVERYLAWIRNNLAYVRRLYPGMYDPRALILIGRRSQLSQENRILLRQLNSNRTVKIRTFDSILDRSRFLTSISKLTMH